MLSLVDVDLEADGDCAYDYIQVFDGHSSAAKSLGTRSYFPFLVQGFQNKTIFCITSGNSVS